MPHANSYGEDRFEKLDPVMLSKLRKPKYLKAVGLLVLDILVIVLAATVASFYLNPVTYILAFLIIGGRMMGLWTLLHDGHHHMILPSKKWNRIVTQLFIAWPLFRSLKQYDQDHSDHHRFLGDEDDPNVKLLKYKEYQFPMKRGQFERILLLDLLGINYIRYFIQRNITNPVKRISAGKTNLIQELKNYGNGMSIGRSVYWVILLSGLAYFGWLFEFVIFWVVPSITWFNMMFRLTTVSDHCFSEHRPGQRSRTLNLNWFEKLFMAPHGLNRHLEHHTYGGVPCYNLEKLHGELMRHSWFRENAPMENGYGSVLRSLSMNNAG